MASVIHSSISPATADCPGWHQHQLKNLTGADINVSDQGITSVQICQFLNEKDTMSLVSTDSSLFLSLSGESESDEDERSNVVDDVWDPVFEEIKHCLYKSDSAKSKTSSEHNSEESVTYNISDYFTNVPYGLQPRDTYEHDKKNTDIMGGKKFVLPQELCKLERSDICI